MRPNPEDVAKLRNRKTTKKHFLVFAIDFGKPPFLLHLHVLAKGLEDSRFEAVSIELHARVHSARNFFIGNAVFLNPSSREAFSWLQSMVSAPFRT